MSRPPVRAPSCRPTRTDRSRRPCGPAAPSGCRRRRSRPSGRCGLGCRLAWRKSDSSRDNVHLTGASSRKRGQRGSGPDSPCPPCRRTQPPFGDEHGGDPLRVDAQHGCGSGRGSSPHALTTGVHGEVPGGVRVGHHEGRLRASRNACSMRLGLEHLVHDVCTSCERGVDVAALVGRAREHVAVELPDRVLVVGEGRRRDR